MKARAKIQSGNPRYEVDAGINSNLATPECGNTTPGMDYNMHPMHGKESPDQPLARAGIGSEHYQCVRTRATRARGQEAMEEQPEVHTGLNPSGNPRQV